MQHRTIDRALIATAFLPTTTGSYRDRPINAAGAELMVLVRTPVGWRITAIHWSSRNVRG